MAVTITHTQTRSVQAGPAYRVHDQATAAVGMQTQVFVFLVNDDSFNRVATVADMQLLANNKPAAVLAGQDAYRLAVVQKDYGTLKTAQDAAATITARLKQLVIDYDAATTAFVGITTATLSS